MCLVPAPVELIIVVSDIGDEWSPYIAPPNTAATNGTTNSGIPSPTAIGTAIGSMIPKVPYEVPVENAMNPDNRKSIAGKI